MAEKEEVDTEDRVYAERETERERDRETERQRDRETERIHTYIHTLRYGRTGGGEERKAEYREERIQRSV